VDTAWWHLVAALASLVLALGAGGHALLYKRDVRAAIGWVGLILLVPVGGSLLYLAFGVNRIRRRALEQPRERLRAASAGRHRARLEELPEPYGALARLGERVNPLPLLAGNQVLPLRDGDEAYPAMLAAIDGAERTIGLATYIFDRDPLGLRFLEALARAVKRGVEVRVLADSVGLRYSWPAMDRELRRAGVPVARFLPSRLPWKLPYANLRNHRKILTVDGIVAFAGGLNLRHGHLLSENPASPVQDLHFRFEGPVVAELQGLFVRDWQFTTREALGGPSWFPPLPERGPVTARVIADGPDEDFERLRWMLLGALAVATRSVRLAQLWQVLERGCRVWLTPPPFDHTKLLLVDDGWALVGSANWDPRSLRLNFEVGIECYEPELGRRLAAIVAAKRAGAREVTLAEMDSRPLPLRLRDGVARLLTPYL
jgi:cardiolipin synthase